MGRGACGIAVPYDTLRTTSNAAKFLHFCRRFRQRSAGRPRSVRERGSCDRSADEAATAAELRADQAAAEAGVPGLQEQDLQQGKSNPDQLVQTIAQKSGQDQQQIEQTLMQVVQQQKQKF